MSKELFDKLVELKERVKKQIALCEDLEEKRKLILRLEDIKEHILLIKKEYNNQLYRNS